MIDKLQAIVNRIENLEVEVKELKFVDFDSFIQAMQDEIDKVEIVYYWNAMEFLTKNDSSLMNSLEIADLYGFELKQLNSEILATLLQRSFMNEDLEKLIPEIKEVFDNNQKEEE